MNHSLPGSSVHGILQARILEWVGNSNTGVSCHFFLQDIFATQVSNQHFLFGKQIFYHWATWCFKKCNWLQWNYLCTPGVFLTYRWVGSCVMIQKIPFMAYLDDWASFINQTPALTNPTYIFFFFFYCLLQQICFFQLPKISLECHLSLSSLQWVLVSLR